MSYANSLNFSKSQCAAQMAAFQSAGLLPENFIITAMGCMKSL